MNVDIMRKMPKSQSRMETDPCPNTQRQKRRLKSEFNCQTNGQTDMTEEDPIRMYLVWAAKGETESGRVSCHL